MADRLRSALPPEIADQVLQELTGARMRQLPTGMLEHRALELCDRGVPPAAIVSAIAGYHRALWLGREALRAGGRAEPADGEIEAAGSVLQKGVDTMALIRLVSAIAPDRLLEVPLLLVAGLLDRGLPVDDILAAMHVWLTSGASDEELRDLAGPPTRPELTVIRASGTALLQRRPRH